MTSPGAQEGGADRLCGLATGAGTSPEPSGRPSVLKETDLPVRVMLRLNDSHTTTGGEFTRLGGLAEEYLSLGAEGVAFGFLDPDLEVDVDTCAALAERLTGVPWTFPATVDACLEPARGVATAARRCPASTRSARPARRAASAWGTTTCWAWPRPTRRSPTRLMPGQGLLAEHVPWLVRAGVRQFHVGRAGPTRRVVQGVRRRRRWCARGGCYVDSASQRALGA